MVEEAYLRTFRPTAQSGRARLGQKYIADSARSIDGVRDLVWALINSKEFLVNH